MDYQIFLSTMIQISSQKRAKIILEDRIIYLESFTSSQKWSLSTKIYEPDQELPAFVRDCLSSRGLFTWQDKGAYLKLNTIDQCVYLMHQVEEQKNYIAFKCLIKDFSYLAKEWREIFQSFSDTTQLVSL